MAGKQPVLVVDDEPRNLRMMEAILGDEVDLRLTASGEQALEILKEFIPDLVFLDVMMPGLDGYEVCQKIRENPLMEFTRIILVSGKVMVEERLKGYQAGADDYFTKPFVPKELQAKVKVFLRLTRAERAQKELNLELENKVRTRTEQLLISERAAFIGTHTAEIIHNLNNPLTILSGNLVLLKTKYPNEEKINTAQKALDRMCEIIRTILHTGRHDKEKNIQDVSINEVIENELKLFESDSFFKYEVKLEKDLKPLSLVRGYYAHFSQSIGNLIKNGIDALHGRN
jgi:two-component system, sensor histidine kinase and response regulator